MQKSCHDMDILLWLVGSNCKKISSFGNLSYFRKENAPKGAAARCLDCPCADECRFDGKKAYLPIKGAWPATVLTEDQTEEGILKALREGPYGRCVFDCDNNVCDNQVTDIEFENGVTATFSTADMRLTTQEMFCSRTGIHTAPTEISRCSTQLMLLFWSGT